VAVIDLDERGDPAIAGTAVRGAVKRSRRATGICHFNVGYTIPCALEPFRVGLSPHTGSRREPPHHHRMIAEDDPDFLILRGLRSDADGGAQAPGTSPPPAP
jgi:hypothetical protein